MACEDHGSVATAKTESGNLLKLKIAKWAVLDTVAMNYSIKSPGLKEGAKACVLNKASHVIFAVTA